MLDSEVALTQVFHLVRSRNFLGEEQVGVRELQHGRCSGLLNSLEGILGLQAIYILVVVEAIAVFIVPRFFGDQFMSKVFA